MTIKQPNIDIAFKQKATSAINRSNRGISILILKNDETENCPSYAVYKEITEFEAAKSKYSADNQQAINDIFTFPPSKVIVVNSDTVSNALVEIEKNVNTGWITIADGTTEDFATLEGGKVNTSLIACWLSALYLFFAVSNSVISLYSA